MSYYDNVKDNVKDKEKGASNKPSFDTLKEEAEKTSVEEEDESTDDGTPIEVLEEGGLRQESSGKERKQSTESSSSKKQETSQTVDTADADLSSIEDKLDKMIQQNERIIEVLESFGS